MSLKGFAKNLKPDAASAPRVDNADLLRELSRGYDQILQTPKPEDKRTGQADPARAGGVDDSLALEPKIDVSVARLNQVKSPEPYGVKGD